MCHALLPVCRHAGERLSPGCPARALPFLPCYRPQPLGNFALTAALPSLTYLLAGCLITVRKGTDHGHLFTVLWLSWELWSTCMVAIAARNLSILLTHGALPNCHPAQFLGEKINLSCQLDCISNLYRNTLRVSVRGFHSDLPEEIRHRLWEAPFTVWGPGVRKKKSVSLCVLAMNALWWITSLSSRHIFSATVNCTLQLWARRNPAFP